MFVEVKILNQKKPKKTSQYATSKIPLGKLNLLIILFIKTSK